MATALQAWAEAERAVERFNPAQPRDPHSGEWIDGPGDAVKKLGKALGKMSEDDFFDAHGGDFVDEYGGPGFGAKRWADGTASLYRDLGKDRVHAFADVDSGAARRLGAEVKWAAGRPESGEPSGGSLVERRQVDLGSVTAEVGYGYDGDGEKFVRITMPPVGSDKKPTPVDLVDLDQVDELVDDLNLLADDLEGSRGSALEAWAEAGRLLEHLPGLHDQRDHGRRFGIPGDPKSGLKKVARAAAGHHAGGQERAHAAHSVADAVDDTLAGLDLPEHHKAAISRRARAVANEHGAHPNPRPSGVPAHKATVDQAVADAERLSATTGRPPVAGGPASQPRTPSAGERFAAETRAALGEVDARKGGGWNLPKEAPAGAKIETARAKFAPGASTRMPNVLTPNDAITRLRGMSDRKSGEQLLAKASWRDLVAILDAGGIPYRKSDNKTKLRTAIIEQLIGRRADSDAITRAVRGARR